MGRLRRGHSLEVIFEEETAEFQPSIARLEEEEYAITKSFRWLYVESVTLLHIHPIFFHLFFFFPFHTHPHRKKMGTHTKVVFFFHPLRHKKNKKSALPFLVHLTPKIPAGLFFFLYPVVVPVVVGPD